MATFEKQLTAKLEKDLKGELDRHKTDLRNEFKEIQEKGFGELLVGVGKAVRDELKKNGGNNSQKRTNGDGKNSEKRFYGGNSGKRQRTEDGRPICYKCGKPGRIARHCGNQGRSPQQSGKSVSESTQKN